MSDKAKKHAEYVRRWNKENPESVRATIAKWRANNPEKVKAINRRNHLKWRKANQEKRRVYQSVRQAIQNGTLLKPNECSKCKSRGSIEGHHTDYTKRFEVIWLCAPCHRAIHRGGKP